MRRQFEGGDNKAYVREASGNYLSTATIRGRRLIEEIRYLPVHLCSLHLCSHYIRFNRRVNVSIMLEVDPGDGTVPVAGSPAQAR